ncbi:MAG: hypothetical protein WC517_02080 [Patescibacteria group bacterium]
MKTRLFLALIFIAITLLGVLGVYVIGTRNSFITQEEDILTACQDMQNAQVLINGIKSQKLLDEHGETIVSVMNNRFGLTQRAKISDQLASYDRDLKNFKYRPIAWIFGFPKIDLDKLSKTFNTKEMEVIDPFNK